MADHGKRGQSLTRRRIRTGITLTVICASSVGALAVARSNARERRFATMNIDTLATLELPLVLHIGASAAFKAPADVQHMLAEMQRIYDQAKIRIVPRIAMDTLATDSIDIYYRPRLAPNGVSHGRNAREIEVRDTVDLRHVADERPERIALPPHLRLISTDPDSVLINQYAANQARTTAHELGHQLALPHRQDVTNLEATGTTGWTLNPREIITMRTAVERRFQRRR